jgi:hypothetical protein
MLIPYKFITGRRQIQGLFHKLRDLVMNLRIPRCRAGKKRGRRDTQRYHIQRSVRIDMDWKRSEWGL